MCPKCKTLGSDSAPKSAAIWKAKQQITAIAKRHRRPKADIMAHLTATRMYTKFSLSQMPAAQGGRLAVKLTLPCADYRRRPRAGRALVCLRAPPSGRKRHEHWHLPAILLVGFTENGRQIAFLELKCHKDVTGGHDCKQEMADSHHGRSPEGDEEAQHERVAHDAVEQWRLKAGISRCDGAQCFKAPP